MALNFFYALGIIGLLLITSGVLIKNKDRKKRDILYMLGGLSLLSYSLYINDTVFIILQVVYTLSVAYDFFSQFKGKKEAK